LKILVTGIAGDIGNGIGRILRESQSVSKLIGCDVHNQHMGQFIFDAFEDVPKVNENDYIDRLTDIAKKYQVDAIVPASEAELRFFFAQGIFDKLGNIPLIMANMKSLEVGFDKFKTAEFLAQNQFPYPWTIKVGKGVPRELPCILKSRFGAGGAEVRLVSENQLISSYEKIFPNHIWQESVGSTDTEYTCGVYRSCNSEIRSIIFLRRLGSGITIYGEVVNNSEIEKLCFEIAESLNLIGSINIQLRLTQRGPVVFEINPRFSSTIVFRHKLGFEDLLWSINERLFGKLPKNYSKPQAGIKIFRKFEEVILFNHE
jgi:carbamoyl-phosphate synthase large subunit